MKHFHSLRILRVEKLTDDCMGISFEIPEDLKETFKFTQGQNLTLRTSINGADTRRTYSIYSTPFDPVLKVAVKKVDEGLFSGWAHETLKAGDEIEVMPPVGKFFTPLVSDQKKNYLAIAAGSGITPILSIIKTTLQTEAASSFTLIYGNRSKSQIIFRDELQDLKDRYINRFRVFNVLSREFSDVDLYHGRINVEKLSGFAKTLIDFTAVDECFICGPEEMIFSSRDFLLSHGIDPKKIHFELFTSADSRKVQKERKEIQKADEGELCDISLRLDGISFNFQLGQEGNSILDEALKHGADLPYACKGGVCTTCKAKLVEGQVVMNINWGLEPDEIDEGFILTCQAHPRTQRVAIDFDLN